MEELMAQLLAEIEMQDARPINDKDKNYLYRQLQFTTIRLDEKASAKHEYQDHKGREKGEARLKAIKPILNKLCKKIEDDNRSMQLFIEAQDDRLKMLHIFLDQVDKVMLVWSYTTYCSATEEYQNDLALLKDIRRYIQKRSDLFDYDVKSVDTFGVIYHLEKQENAKAKKQS